MLRKRGSKFGFITSDGCNPSNVDNYNRIEGRTSIPTWFEVIEWFENLYPNIYIEIRKCENLEGESDEVNSFIESIVVTKKTKDKIESCFISNSKVYPVNHLEPTYYKNYKNDILIAAINKAIDYYKSIKQ